MRALLPCATTVGFVLSLPCAAFAQFNYDDIVKAVFRNAIVKVEVSAATAVIQDGKNICNSLGTGFFVTSSHVVTAAHVFAIPAECGPPTISLVSHRFAFRNLAKVLGEKDDIAVLQSETAFPEAICALGIRVEDAFETNGYRLGIPGGLPEPSPANVYIGPRVSSFSPLVHLTGAPAEPGESGGPVLVHFNVVGVLKARHANYIGHSFMIPAGTLRKLASELGISRFGKVCNPVENLMSPDGRTIFLQPDPNLSAPARAAILKQIEIEALTSQKASREDITVRRVDDAISVAVPDIVLPQKTCTRIFGLNLGCKTEPKAVPNLDASVKIARDIGDRISHEMLAETLGRLPPPRL